jgi:hypothetical protein
MRSLIPTRKQWKSWSKPTKYQFVGLIIAILALFSVPQYIFSLFPETEAPSYEKQRGKYISGLNDASTCLASRLYVDDIYDLQSDCTIDLNGLSDFLKTFSPYMATTPYSGAWNLEKYGERVEAAAAAVNEASSRQDLLRSEKELGLSLSDAAYYMCGLEWYLRLAPPDPIGSMSLNRVKSYQRSWLDWLRFTKKDFRIAPFTHDRYQVLDDPDCSSFIDLLD